MVVDGPIFKKKLEIVEFRKVVDDQYCGHIIIDRAVIVNKSLVKQQ